MIPQSGSAICPDAHFSWWILAFVFMLGGFVGFLTFALASISKAADESAQVLFKSPTFPDPAWPCSCEHCEMYAREAGDLCSACYRHGCERGETVSVTKVSCPEG